MVIVFYISQIRLSQIFYNHRFHRLNRFHVLWMVIVFYLSQIRLSQTYTITGSKQ